MRTKAPSLPLSSKAVRATDRAVVEVEAVVVAVVMVAVVRGAKRERRKPKAEVERGKSVAVVVRRQVVVV